jgi:hypothetical protein
VGNLDRTKRSISFDKPQVLAKLNITPQGLVRETLEIEKIPNNVKREDSFKFSSSWKPVLGFA